MDKLRNIIFGLVIIGSVLLLFWIFSGKKGDSAVRNIRYITLGEEQGILERRKGFWAAGAVGISEIMLFGDDPKDRKLAFITHQSYSDTVREVAIYVENGGFWLGDFKTSKDAKFLGEAGGKVAFATTDRSDKVSFYMNGDRVFKGTSSEAKEFKWPEDPIDTRKTTQSPATSEDFSLTTKSGSTVSARINKISHTLDVISSDGTVVSLPSEKEYQDIQVLQDNEVIHILILKKDGEGNLEHYTLVID